ncbi:MAG: hypothetical protein Q9176_006032 [Flavoplaca citrina]
MIATPIFIHTFVVFVRLFWFERRFQHIAREARHLRHARTRSRTKTEVKNEADPEKSEKGVRGRSIVVLHKNEGADRSEDRLPAAMSKKLDDSEPTSSSSSSQEEKSAFDRTGVEAQLDQAPSLHREVTFADQVDDVEGPRTCTQRLPLRQTAEEHIAFLEKQRNPQGKSTLRIPGPRDFDQGHVPETVAEDDDGGALTYKTTSPVDDSTNSTAEPVRRNITIDEPKRPRQRASTGLSKISVPAPRSNYIAHAKTTSPNGEDDNVDDQKGPHSARLKARTVVTEIGSVGYRLLNGLFQASSTRTAGFSTVNLAGLHPGIQVSYMVMMYISVFPIAISVRRTNVYEEKSLGIYTNGGENDEHANEPSYVGAHLRRQLSFDLWYIFLGLFIIAIAEGNHIRNMNEDSFTMYSCLFEIVSAYGTVGLSLGYPDNNTSFCGQFSVVSKLVIIAMQIRGRHRGLPYELDRAILLPSESLHKKEDMDAAQRAQRRNSSLSNLQPTSPSGACHAATTGREQHTQSTRSSIVGDAGHSGKAGSMVGKMMAGLAAGPHFERRPQPHG